MKAHALNHRDIWFDANAITDVLSSKKVCNKFYVMSLATHVTAKVLLLCTSWMESTHTLTCMPTGFTAATLTMHCQVTVDQVPTVKIESEGFSKKQIEQKQKELVLSRPRSVTLAPQTSSQLSSVTSLSTVL
jgi:hypothetical protein